MKEACKNFNGVTSTAIPRFELIPRVGLESLAARFELGVERKGEGAWNALREDLRDVLKDGSFVIERLSHCISHSLDAIQKVNRGEVIGEDDAGAIMFAGCVLAEWRKMKIEEDADKK